MSRRGAPYFGLFFLHIASAIVLGTSEPPSDSDDAPGLSLSEEQAVVVGIQGNLQLLADKYDVSIAEARELSAGAWLNPSLFLDSQLMPFGANWDQQTSGGPTQRDIMITQPIDFSGKQRNAHRGAREVTRAQEAAFQDAVRTKSLAIRVAYIEVIQRKEELRLLVGKSETIRALIESVKRRMGSSDLSPLIPARSELALERAELEIKAKTSEVLKARHVLAGLLGKSLVSDDIDEVDRLNEFNHSFISDSQKLVEMALDRRPDLKRLEFTLNKSRFDHRLESAKVWDNLALSGGLSHQEMVNAAPGVVGSRSLNAAWSWLIAISIPLPVLNQNNGNIKAALLATEQTEKRLQALRHSIQIEVQSLASRLPALSEQIDDYENKVLKQARLVRNTAQRQFGTGASTLLEYLDAVDTYQSTLSAYVETLAAFRRTKGELRTVVAGDIEQ